ncbi:MAG: NnrU family protein [Burkholderiales bacterium]|jgi:uncharacterized membrane protein|nr:NnrU family protein [Burkholderiales bacterium]
MTVLILGLIVFLAAHSLRIFAPDWRAAQQARLGEMPFKGIVSLISVASFVAIVWGYGLARGEAANVVLYVPPLWTRHLASLLTLAAFVLLVAAYVPRNHIKQKFGHPMAASVKIWALAHLLANGRLADVLLFGAFLVWAILSFTAGRKRDRAAGTVYPQGTLAMDAVTVVVGFAAWAAFAFYLHKAWIGVAPFAR